MSRLKKKNDNFIHPGKVEILSGSGRSLSPVQKARTRIKKESLEDPQGEKVRGAGKIIDPPYDLGKLYEYYEENVYHNACCNVKAQVVTGEYEIVGVDLDREPDAEYDKLSMFLDSPNTKTGDDFHDILEKIWLDYESLGNGYLEISENLKGEIQEIGHLPAITIRKAKDALGYYQLNYSGNPAVYFRRYGDLQDPNISKTKILHIKNYYARSSYYGVPDVIPALGAMYVMRGAETFLSKFFDNAAILGVIISVMGGKLSKDARTDLKNLIEYGLVGVQNAHKVALLDSLSEGTEVKIDRIITDFKSHEIRQLMELDRNLIIAAHHVPPKLLGIATPGQLGASNDSWGQMKVFDIIEIRPSKRKLSNWVNRNILTGLNINNWQIVFPDMDIRADKEKNEELWGDVERNIIDINEARKERGLQPVDDQEIDLEEVADKLEKIEKSLNKLEQ